LAAVGLCPAGIRAASRCGEIFRRGRSAGQANATVLSARLRDSFAAPEHADFKNR
jgi:hypothetical protein